MLDRQLKGVIAMVKQQAENLHEKFSSEWQVTLFDIEATQLEVAAT
jgi:hypothetical protein